MAKTVKTVRTRVIVVVKHSADISSHDILENIHEHVHNELRHTWGGTIKHAQGTFVYLGDPYRLRKGKEK